MFFCTERNYAQARYHYIHSTDGEACAQMLLEFHRTQGFPSEVDMFITQAVLQYVVLFFFLSFYFLLLLNEMGYFITWNKRLTNELKIYLLVGICAFKIKQLRVYALRCTRKNIQRLARHLHIVCRCLTSYGCYSLH